MKKFFLFLAAALMNVSMNAEKLTFVISNGQLPEDTPEHIEAYGSFGSEPMSLIGIKWWADAEELEDNVDATEDDTFGFRCKIDGVDKVLGEEVAGEWIPIVRRVGDYWEDWNTIKWISFDSGTPDTKWDGAHYKWIDAPVEATIIFAANNKTKEVTVALPHTFACDWDSEEGELDIIIQELYELSLGGFDPNEVDPVAEGSSAVSAGYNEDTNMFITVSEIFEGKATVSGKYAKYIDLSNEEIFDFSLEISIKGEDPQSISTTAVNVKAVKVIRDGQILIIRDGKTFNAVGAEVK